MARTVKAKSTDAQTTETTTTTTSSVVPDAGVTVTSTEKKVKKAKAPKADITTTPSTQEVSKTDEAVASEVVVDAETSINEQSLDFSAKLQQLSLLISTLKVDYRNLEKKWQREFKTVQKQNSKRKRKVGNRAPSGFVKPARISDELAKFLEKTPGTEMARTEVTRDINKYIRTNNLQDKENGRKINADAKLASLLKLKKTDELTYFNLQRYMSPHFAKAAVAVKVEAITTA